MSRKNLIVSLFVVFPFLFSCSHQEKKQKQEEREKDTQEVVQEQQAREDFDPSGLWQVATPPKGCVAMAGYESGDPPTLMSDFFQCQSLPIETPEISGQVEIDYNEEQAYIDVNDGGQIRRIPLSITDIDFATEPLVVLEPREIAPGCSVHFARLNGVMFLNENMARQMGYDETATSNRMTYLVTFSMRFVPSPASPGSCTEHLARFGTDMMNGRTDDPLMDFLSQTKAFDMARIGQLRDVNIIYFYDASKMNIEDDSVNL